MADLITEPDALRLIEPEWRELAELRENAFVTPDWFFAWLRHYGEHWQPAVTVLRGAEGRVKGILPLAVATSRRPRSLCFAGSGFGDSFHPVCPPSADDEVATAAGRELARLGHPWSTLVLENVDGGTWWQKLAGSAPEALTTIEHRALPLPYIDLTALSWESYLASRSRGFRNQARRKLRALESEHDVEFRRTDDAAEVARDMETLFRLHDARWATQPGNSSLAGHQPRAFLTDFATSAQDRGWLRLWILEIDGAPAAAWCGWRLGGRYAYYQAGFDPAWSDRSVGFLLMAHAIRDAIAEGASGFDMLLGDEPFKSRFADEAKAVKTVVLAKSRHPARLLAATELGARRVARKLPHAVREPSKRAARNLISRLPAARRR